MLFSGCIFEWFAGGGSPVCQAGLRNVALRWTCIKDAFGSCLVSSWVGFSGIFGIIADSSKLWILIGIEAVLAH